MAKIELCGVTKRFGKITALKNVNLEIKDKEFFVLFGPAGAGKTTILNNIAGLQIPEEGMVKIGGEIVNQKDPADRNVAMVFENYALYPHLSVYDNIAAPLRGPRFKKDPNNKQHNEELIKEAVNKVAAMMKIDKLLERLPSQLSNGQRQRVALGRALVRDPNVFLMDEPLAHLDAKLRNAMRSELKEMQAAFGTTSIYVTHDFMEAMSLGDRIAIINEGEIIQIGTGDEIYYMPCNEFVATLMGDPVINLLKCNLAKGASGYEVIWDEAKDQPIALPADKEIESRFAGVERVDVGVRPQNVHYHFEQVPGSFKGRVYSFETIGNKSVLLVQVGENGHLRLIVPNGLNVKLDQDIYVTFEIDRAILFDPKSTEYIGRFDEAAVRKLVAEQAKEA